MAFLKKLNEKCSVFRSYLEIDAVKIAGGIIFSSLLKLFPYYILFDIT